MKSSISDTSEGRATGQVGSQDSPRFSVNHIPAEEAKPKMTIKLPKAKMIRLGRGNGDNGFLDRANIKGGEFLCALAVGAIPQNELECPPNWKTDPEKRIDPDLMLVPTKYIQVMRDMYNVQPREHQATRLKEKRPVNEQLDLLTYRKEPIIKVKEGSHEPLDLVDDGDRAEDKITTAKFGNIPSVSSAGDHSALDELETIKQTVNSLGGLQISDSHQIEKIKRQRHEDQARNRDQYNDLADQIMELKDELRNLKLHK